MAELKNDAINNIQKRIDKAVSNLHKEKGFDKIANETALQVKKRTQISKGGAGKDKDGNALKPLKSKKGSTIDIRTRHKKRLSKKTSPATSNLTATGQMLDAITYKIAPFLIYIFVKDDKRKQELSGSHGRLTNSRVARYAKEGGRSFMGLIKYERKALARKLREFILDRIRKSTR